MALVARVASLFFILCVPALLITSNIRFLATDVRFYEYGFRKFDADENTGLDMAVLDDAAQQIVDYFTNDAETLVILVVEDGETVPLFDERETQHMEDVKGLMRVVFRINEFSLAYVLGYIGLAVLWSGEVGVRQLSRRSLVAIGAGFAVVAAVGVFALAGFERAWNQFHEIFFRNDLWQLDPDTDSLIQMFPEEFWAEATLIVAVLTLVEAAAIVGFATWYLLKTRSKRRAAET